MGQVPEVISAFYDGADANVEMTVGFVRFAKAMGVKTAGYESGPGYAVGSLKPGSTALNTLITAARDPGAPPLSACLPACLPARLPCWAKTSARLSTHRLIPSPL
jgi:hypothetical protein